MKPKINKMITVLEVFLIIVIGLINITGQNKLISIYKVLIVMLAIIPFFMVNSENKKVNFAISKQNILWGILYFIFALSIFYTIDLKSTLYFLVIYACGFLFIYHKFSNKFWHNILNVLEIISIVVAITIFMEKLMPSIFNFLFGWFGNWVPIQYSSIAKGYYSGILFEGARAAFVTNIGIACVYSKILNNSGNRWGNIIKLIVLVLALFLTGKRTLTAIGIFLMLFMYIITNNKNKKAYKKLAIIIFCAVIILIILAFVIPDLVKPFKRMFNIGSNFGGRMVFWQTSINMFKEAPILGKGIGSFNKYLANNGFTYYGALWTSHAHNSYLQIMGETGIVGLFFVAMLIGTSLFKSFKLLKRVEKEQKVILLASIYIQLLFIIYALTGNPFHNFYEIYLYIVFVNYVIQTYNEKEISEKKDE